MADKETPTFGTVKRGGQGVTPPPARKAPPPPPPKHAPVAPASSAATPAVSNSGAPEIARKKMKPQLVSNKPKSKKTKYIVAGAAVVLLAGVGGGVGAMMAGGSSGYQVTFKTINPFTGVATTQTYKVKPGNPFPLPTTAEMMPFYPGYNFVGWVYEQDYDSEIDWDVDGNPEKLLKNTSGFDTALTLVAVYNPRPFNVILWTGIETGQTVKKTGKIGTTVTITETPNKPGYDFLGWSEVEEGPGLTQPIIPGLSKADIDAAVLNGSGISYSVPLNGKNLYPVWKGVTSVDVSAVFTDAKGTGLNTTKVAKVGETILITELPQNATHWIVKRTAAELLENPSFDPEMIKNQFFPGEEFVMPAGGVTFVAVSSGPAVSGLELSFVIPGIKGLTKTSARIMADVDTLDVATLNSMTPYLGNAFSVVKWQVYSADTGTVNDVTEATIANWRTRNATENQRIVLLPVLQVSNVTYRYDMSGGVAVVEGGAFPQGATVTYGTAIQLPSAREFFYKDKTFLHWAVETNVGTFTFLDGESVILSSELATSDIISFTPVWGDIRNLVFFHFNGGSVLSGWVPPVHTDPSEFIAIPTVIPVRAGHTFMGWNKNQFASPADPNNMLPGKDQQGKDKTLPAPIDGPVIYFAIWAPVQFIAAFDKGQYPDATITNIPTNLQGIAFNSTLAIPSETPQRTGYTFSHWELGYYQNKEAATGFQNAIGTTITGGAWNFLPGDLLYANASIFNAIPYSLDNSEVQLVFRAVWDINYVRVTLNQDTIGSGVDLSAITVTLSNPIFGMQAHINAMPGVVSGTATLEWLLANSLPYGTQITIINPSAELKPYNTDLYGDNADFVSFVINPKKIGQNFDLEYNGNLKVDRAEDEFSLYPGGNILFTLPDVSGMELFASFMYTRVDVGVLGATNATIIAGKEDAVVVVKNTNGTDLRHGQNFTVPDLANFVGGATEIFDISSDYHLLGWTLKRADGTTEAVIAGNVKKAQVGDVLIPRIYAKQKIDVSYNFNYKGNIDEIVAFREDVDISLIGITDLTSPGLKDTIRIELPSITSIRNVVTEKPSELFTYKGWQIGYVNLSGDFVVLQTVNSADENKTDNFFIITGSLLDNARLYNNIMARVIWENEGSNILFRNVLGDVIPQTSGITVDPVIHEAVFDKPDTTLTQIINELVSKGNLSVLNRDLDTAVQQLGGTPTAAEIVDRMLRNVFNMPQNAKIDLIKVSGTTIFEYDVENDIVVIGDTDAITTLMNKTFTASDSQIEVLVKFAGSTLAVNFDNGSFDADTIAGLSFDAEELVPVGEKRSFNLAALSSTISANTYKVVGSQLIGFTSVQANQQRQPQGTENSGVYSSTRTFFPLGYNIELTSAPLDFTLTLYPVYVQRAMQIQVWNGTSYVEHGAVIGDFGGTGNITLPASIGLTNRVFRGYSLTNGGALGTNLVTNNTLTNGATVRTLAGNVSLNEANFGISGDYLTSADYLLTGNLTTGLQVNTRNMVVKLYPVFIDTFVTVNFEGNTGASVQVQYTGGADIAINNQNDPLSMGTQHFAGWELVVPGDTTYKFVPGQTLLRTQLNYFFTQLGDTNRSQSVTLTAKLENASAAADANREIAGTTVVLNAAHITSGRIVAPQATKIVIAADVTNIPYNAIYAPLATSIVFSGGQVGQGGAEYALDIKPGAFVAPSLTAFFIPSRIGELSGNPVIGVATAGIAPALVVLSSFVSSSAIPLVSASPRFSWNSTSGVLEDRLTGNVRILAVINTDIEAALATATATRIGGYAISHRNNTLISIPRNITVLDANAISNMPNATELRLADTITSLAGGANSAISGYMNLQNIKVNTTGGTATSTGVLGSTGAQWKLASNVVHGVETSSSNVNKVLRVAQGGLASTTATQIHKDALNGLTIVPANFAYNNTGFVEFSADDFGPTVKSIAGGAFANMTKLATLTLPKQLDGDITDGALSANNSLVTLAVVSGNSRYTTGGGNSYMLEGTVLIAGTKNVTLIPSTVTRIRDFAFAGLSNTYFGFYANGLTADGNAFAENTVTNIVFVSATNSGLTPSLITAIKNISTNAKTIEFNMTEINNNNNWYSLFADQYITSAKIGVNVASILGNPFEGATYLTSFVVDGANPTFAVSDSRMLMKIGAGQNRTLIAYANGTATSANISSDAAHILTVGNFSTGTNTSIFTNGAVITSVIYLDSGAAGSGIAQGAFSTATNVANLTFANQENWTTTASRAFDGLSSTATALTTIAFKSNSDAAVALLNAFGNVGGLLSGANAAKLSINTTGALTNGHTYLFGDTNHALGAVGSLTGVTISNFVTSITGNPFIGAKTLTNFSSFASGITGSGATLTLSSSNTLIAYANASSDTVTLSAFTNYGNGSAKVFTNASVIKNFTMSADSGTVNANAFGGMTLLDVFTGTGTAATWNTTFNANAFSGSTFSGTGTVAFASTATMTGISSTLATALAPLSGVKVLALNVPGVNGSLASFLNTTGIPTVNIGASLISITGNPFVGATSLTSFAGGNARITNVLTGKGIAYTSDTMNMTSANFLIAQINTAGTVSVTHTHVGNGAVIFTNLAAVTDVSITSTVQAIGNNAFDGVAFASNTVTFSHAALKSIGANAFNNTNISTVAIASASNINGTVAVNAFGNAPIAQITVKNGGAIPTGANSFGAALLNRLNVAGGIRRIYINTTATGETIGTGYKAFLQGMTREFELRISAPSSSVAFANGAFSNIPWLDMLAFDSVTSIAGIYDNASAVFVGSGIRTAGDTNLDNGGYILTLYGLTSVPAYLFSGTSLANPGGIREIVNMPSGTIGEFAFAYNTRLNRIGDIVGVANIASTNIGTYAFAFNRFSTANLTGAHTDSTNIGQYAFYRDTALTINLTTASGVPITGVGGIAGPYMGVTIRVPSSLLTKFKDAYGWTQYASLIQGV